MSLPHLNFSTPIQMLIERSLTLSKLLLKHDCHFYPFAAVFRDNCVHCVFSDHASDTLSPSYLLELLQWEVIDSTTGTNSFSVIVFNAEGKDLSGTFDAIAMTIKKPNGEEIELLYPYTRDNGNIVIAPPVTD